MGVQFTRNISGLMCGIGIQRLIRGGYSVPGTVLRWHVVSMVWNGDQRLIHNSVQCTRYMSGLACGEYGIEWWPVIDSQFGTVYPVTWSVRHVVIMVQNFPKKISSDWFAAGYSVPGTVLCWHVVSMVTVCNGDKRLIRSWVQVPGTCLVWHVVSLMLMIESDTLAIEAYIRACCSWFELVTQVVFKSFEVSNIIYFAL